MPAYIVRTIETLRLVGVFVARNPSELFAVVDEVLCAGQCEYFKLNNDEGVFLDGQFTAEAECAESPLEEGAKLYVHLRAVPEAEATPPEFSERLAQRLDRGRSWTAFTDTNFAEAFGLLAHAVPRGAQ